MIGDATDRTGTPFFTDLPTDDAEFTWHLHDADTVDLESGIVTEWGTGISCRACQKERAVHSDGKQIHWAISRLKNTNAAGVTQNEMRQEIYDNARRDGRDIERA